ncbi:protocadherin beta-2 isoform X1 [Octopus bimaculoides]|uniref:Cadherin domain-containing protein n=2 Tax=Octopus bimaculoides TaxID=37653 RepID=A0A0L8GRZ6_OCTBM|nr:protocadherin beta-2 isoform X1 [Octopus bimaculoides]|eukprot:XP_014778543.1 PREDICTED: protocadherin beta-2-like isoform X1 [Octopus bimaculoides]
MLIKIYAFLFLLQASLCIDLTYYVEEGQNPGSYIGDIAADTHLVNGVPLKDHSLFWFQQLQKGNESSSKLFNISKSGKLYTAQILDAESLCKYNTECFRMVEVAVRNRESFVKILEIKIIIKDVNDNRPDFQSKEFHLEFTESDMKGTTKFIPNAIDRDVGILNSQLKYRLRKEMSEPFTLSVSRKHDGSTELGIVLEEKLDRELKDSYHVQVVANDGGLPCVLDVSISVADINDNRPVFSQNIYNITVNNGHLIYIPVVILSAKDLDSGKNGRISYYFSTKSSALDISYFELNKTSGELFLHQKFFTEPKKSYKLLIEARDEGIPPLSSTAIVLVNVINQQNNAPDIDINFISLTTNDVASIFEGVKVNSFIAYVKVTDNDIGQNGEVTCELEHDKLQLQSLGKMKYKIVIKSHIDREIDNFLHFTITCQDNGTPPLRTTKNFSIQVMDVNDVHPQFTKDTFKFLIFENEEPNFPIGFINATDPDLDSGSELTYSLLNNQGYLLPFEISNFGFISTTQSLDREQQDVYKFKVLVKDNGTPSLNNTANVVVEVIDKNDNAPYFTFPSVDPFNLDVHYHPQGKNDITALRASDRDSHVNAFLQYEILGGNDKQLFAVNLYTGVLSFSRPVYQNDAGSYNLQFVVKDSGAPVLSATSTLSLTLTVSNKTSKMFTAVHKQSDDKIHINLLIIMLVATVIVALVVVISITVCIVRRNNLRNNQYTSGVDGSKLFSQNNLSEYICGQVVPQYDVPVTVVSEQEHNRSSQSTLLRQDPQLVKKSGQSWKIPPPGTQLPNTMQVAAQKTPQRIAAAPDVEKENRTVATLSNSYSGKGLLNRDARLYEELPGHKSSQLHTLSRGKHTNPTTKGSNEGNICPNPTSNDVIDLKSIRVTSASPNIPSQHWNLPMRNSFTSYAKPLPAVPKDTKTELM